MVVKAVVKSKFSHRTQEVASVLKQAIQTQGSLAHTMNIVDIESVKTEFKEVTGRSNFYTLETFTLCMLIRHLWCFIKPFTGDETVNFIAREEAISKKGNYSNKYVKLLQSQSVIYILFK